MESGIPWNEMEFDGTVPIGIDKNIAKFPLTDSTIMIPKFHFNSFDIPLNFHSTFNPQISS